MLFLILLCWIFCFNYLNRSKWPVVRNTGKKLNLLSNFYEREDSDIKNVISINLNKKDILLTIYLFENIVK